MPHATQTSDVPPPTVLLYAPAAHDVQAVIDVAPVSAEKRPAAHFVHTAAEEAPVAAEYVPPTHDVQEELAGSVLYMPAVHGTQDAGSF